jgi:hypothetical protein
MRVSLVAVLALVVIALTTGASGEQAGTVVRSELAGQPARLALPTGQNPKGVVVWFHGQGGDVDAHADNPFLTTLHRDGYAIASSSFHLKSWGNPASTADTRRLVEWAEGIAGVPVVLWVAGSMGGSVSLNAMLHGVEPPPCWYGVHPAISLSDMGTVPGALKNIQKAYGGDPPASRDPVRNVDQLPREVRYRVVASPQDPLVGYEDNVTPLVTGLEERGAEVTSLPVTGNHEDPSHWNAQDLLAFAESCSGEAAGQRAAE